MFKKYLVSNVIYNLFRLLFSLPKKYIYLGISLVFLMVFTGILELLNVAFSIPFISSLTSNSLSIPNLLDYPVNFILNISSDHFEERVVFLFLFITLTLLTGLFKLITLYFITRYAAHTGSSISSRYFFSNINTTLEDSFKIKSSDVINALTLQVDRVSDSVTWLLQLIAAIIVSTFLVLGLFIVSFSSAAIVISTLALIYLFTINFVRKKLKISSDKIMSSDKKRVQLIQTSLNSVRDMILTSSSNLYLVDYSKLDLPRRITLSNIKVFTGSPRYIIETFGLILLVFCTLIITDSDRTTSISLFAGLAFGIQKLIPSFQQIYASWSTLKGYNSDINVFLSTALNRDKIDLLYPTYNSRINIPIDSIKSVSFENINYAYKNSSPVLNNFSLSLKKGDFIGIVGKSGSGKTTLIDILTGLLLPSDGQIYVNNILVFDSSSRVNILPSLYKFISYSPQFSHIYSDTILNNIIATSKSSYFDPIKFNEVLYLSCSSEFVDDLPYGINTDLGEGSCFLSGGQLQRISLARTLYRDFSILVLDEATSSLDKTTELEVISRISQKFSDKIIIMVTHNTSLLRFCNKTINLS